MKSLLFALFVFGSFVLSAQNSQQMDTIIYRTDSVNHVVITVPNWGEINYEFKDDYRVPDGLYTIEFHRSRTQFHYKNGLKHGRALSYQEDTLVSAGNFNNGKHDGDCFDRLEKDLIRHGQYRNNRRKGKWVYTNASGVTVAKGRYSGKQISSCTISERLCFIEPDGDTIKFESGADYRAYLMKYDYDIQGRSPWLRVGKWEFYDKNGVLLRTSFYDSDGRLKGFSGTMPDDQLIS